MAMRFRRPVRRALEEIRYGASEAAVVEGTKSASISGSAHPSLPSRTEGIMMHGLFVTSEGDLKEAGKTVEEVGRDGVEVAPSVLAEKVNDKWGLAIILHWNEFRSSILMTAARAQPINSSKLFISQVV